MKIKFSIRKKRISRSSGGDFAIFVFILISAAFMALPLILITSNAFKPLSELFIFPPRFYVRYPTLDNFRDLIILMSESWIPFTRYLANSLLVVVLGTGGHVLIASLGAFVVSKYEFPGKKFFSTMVLLSLMFAPQVTRIPTYMIMAEVGWVNNLTALIVPAWQYSLGFYLMSKFMGQIPDTILEAATIDGASKLKIFWSIVMPYVKPAWLTLVILSFQMLWADTGNLYIYSEAIKPLPNALFQIAAGGIARTGVHSVVLFFMMLVPVTLFLFNQSRIVETMGTSGID